MRTLSFLFGAMFGLSILGGCASYQTKVAPAKNLLQDHRCDEALPLLEKLSAAEGGDQLALLMEYGTALQICGDYAKSSDVLSRAERLADAVNYTSVTQVVGATFVNDEMITYKGDTFEKIFLNASKALNYLQESNYEAALVEVRKMNQKFTAYQNEERKPIELNSFAKYLSALIWEATGQLDDACIDYKDAYFLDPKYREVGQQMLNTCWAAHRPDEFNSLVKRMQATPDEIKEAKSSGPRSEVIYIFLNGWGPQKRERPDAPTIPYLVRSAKLTDQLGLDLFDSSQKMIFQAASVPIYSVNDAATASLEADYAPLIARRIGSRIAKGVLASQIAQKDQALGMAAWVLMRASEKADLRQWSFLPDSIQIIRVPVVPGNYRAETYGQNSMRMKTESFSSSDLIVAKSKKVIKLLRSLK